MKQANTYRFGSSPSNYFVSRNYRNSFQGQEHHDEIRGKGNYINYKYRGHDPRIGRLDWLVDPLAAQYPWNSPYAFSENRVLDGVELEGLEWKATEDKSGNLTGFDWDPDNAYDNDGNLNSGYFETAVLFSEKNTPPSSGSANKESGFHATATVYKADGTTEDYDATTLPSDSKLFGTVEAGLYKATKGTHPMSGGYTALNVYTLAGSRNLPAKDGLNPRNGSKYVSGVNIHKTGRNDYLGTYNRSNGTIGGISEGCFCIRRGSGDNLYNDFMESFSEGQIIGVGLIRGQKPKVSVANTETIDIQINYYFEPVPVDNTYVAPIILR